MVAIADSTLRSNVYETVYDLINSALSSMGASSTPTLYGGYPDNPNVDFPVIILKPVNVDKDEATIDTSRTASTKMVRVTIEIYSTKNKDLDIINDYLDNLLQVPIQGLDWNNSSDDDMISIPNGNKVKGKTLVIMYKRR